MGRRAVYGLIPAHAGKTTRPVSRSQPTTAHPRSRGENTDAAALIFGTTGSSPLTRGKPRADSPPYPDRRLIPAHAGKTARQGRGYPSPRAHPRSRGENVTRDSMFVGIRGSSPLTRGKRSPRRTRSSRSRLIPAHAGKTSRPPVASSSTEAHPRSRGENNKEHARVIAPWGSSPLTRGKP